MYQFPLINDIEDVLSFIRDDENFVVADCGDYVIINYVLSNSSTFPHSFDLNSRIRRECRGITFDKNGKLIRRPYHKFFNLNEREETLSKNISSILLQDSISLDKIDGSMVAPAFIHGEIVMMTKMGNTDVAKNCEQFLSRNENVHYYRFMRDWLKEGFTPIFEWISPENRIVIDYQREALILCAMRDMHSGVYLSYEKMKELAERYNIEIVSLRTTLPSSNVEGIVYRFGPGHMVKVKTEWYVNLHKMKEQFLFERNVVSSILEEKIDDMKPFVLESERQKLENYENELENQLIFLADQLCENHKKAREFGSRKEFGLARKNEKVPFSSAWDHFIFKNWNEEIQHSVAKSLISNELLNCCSSNSKFRSFWERYGRTESFAWATTKADLVS